MNNEESGPNRDQRAGPHPTGLVVQRQQQQDLPEYQHPGSRHQVAQQVYGQGELRLDAGKGKAKPTSTSSAPAASKPATASKKRKSTEADFAPVPTVNLDDIDVDDLPRDKNCDQVRRLIMRFLDSKAMTKTAFANEIGVSMKSLNGFLGVSGPMNGSGFAAYDAAWEFFKKREIAGIPMPTNKKQKTTPNSAAPTAEAGSSTSGYKTGSKSSKSQPAGEVDVSDIHLDGEETDSVPVFDTCDEVRKKINAYLQRPGVTQASLCRAIYAQLKGPSKPSNPFQSGQLTRFRNMKGPCVGAKLPLFYGAYVFFEKVRIKEGRPKSKHRLEMEEEWGPGGMRRDFDGRESVICLAGTILVMNRYGKMDYIRDGTGPSRAAWF
ncbi:hypothetical protein VTJ04DRAFT_3411 [Mycothermus thermophilus]|uniref:uncharacterized protein n=1 Tax=Humicola insolens TaxID=85995 RepID=UPI00374408F6